MSGLRPESLTDFLAWKPPHIKQLVGCGLLIPQGKAILVGKYKSWKSMTAIDLGFKLASGQRWLGFPTHMSTVLAIQLEIPKFAYQERVLKYVLGNKLNPSNLYFITAPTLKLDKGWGIAQLDAWINEIHPQVIIIDPIYRVVTGRLTDEYDVRQFTDRIDDIIERHKVSVVLVHHEGKDMIVEGERVDRGADASFGSAVFGWWAQTLIELRKVGGDNSSTIQVSFPLTSLAVEELKPLTVEINRDNLVFTVKEVGSA